MPAHIVERVDIALAIPDQEEWKASFRDLKIIATVGKPQLVGHHDPLLGEDSPSF
jgi:hypothetical protein